MTMRRRLRPNARLSIVQPKHDEQVTDEDESEDEEEEGLRNSDSRITIPRATRVLVPLSCYELLGRILHNSA